MDSIQHYAEGTQGRGSHLRPDSRLPSPSSSMARSSQTQAPGAQRTSTGQSDTNSSSRRHRTAERSDVHVSAVISTYLLTHLHHVLHDFSGNGQIGTIEHVVPAGHLSNDTSAQAGERVWCAP